MEGHSNVFYDELKLRKFISEGSYDFNGWISLVSEMERTFPGDIEKISLIYDTFLSKFPLCHGYWRKYVAHKTRLSCTADSIIKVFERAVQSATYSVGVWVDYCHFSMSVFDDPDDVRRLFKRALSFVRKDYLCSALLDKYIEFEYQQQQWSSLVSLYIQILRFPSKKLHYYYDCFKKFADIYEDEMRCQNNYVLNGDDIIPSGFIDDDIISYFSNVEISSIIKDLEDSSHVSNQLKALKKYIYFGERFYQESSQLDAKISPFEACIQRTYFDVIPLDDIQLENWHHYLDFVEIQGDFDWAVKLYERCLIPCANYFEFWVRYVEFMESKGGREIANFALDRATQVFLKSAPLIHFFNAWFKEKTMDFVSARAAFLLLNTNFDSNFVASVIKEANMERRLGNFAAASNTFKMAIELAAKRKSQMLPSLYIHYSRLNYKITGSIDAVKDIIIQGIRHVPHCKLLLEELIKFMLLHGDPKNLIIVDSIIAEKISPGVDASEGLSAIDREGISNLYLEFADLCGTVEDVRRAWNRHIMLFPHSVRTKNFYEQPAPTTACSKLQPEVNDIGVVPKISQNSLQILDGSVAKKPNDEMMHQFPTASESKEASQEHNKSRVRKDDAQTISLECPSLNRGDASKTIDETPQSVYISNENPQAEMPLQIQRTRAEKHGQLQNLHQWQAQCANQEQTFQTPGVSSMAGFSEFPVQSEGVYDEHSMQSFNQMWQNYYYYYYYYYYQQQLGLQQETQEHCVQPQQQFQQQWQDEYQLQQWQSYHLQLQQWQSYQMQQGNRQEPLQLEQQPPDPHQQQSQGIAPPNQTSAPEHAS